MGAVLLLQSADRWLYFNGPTWPGHNRAVHLTAQSTQYWYNQILGLVLILLGCAMLLIPCTHVSSPTPPGVDKQEGVVVVVV